MCIYLSLDFWEIKKFSYFHQSQMEVVSSHQYLLPYISIHSKAAHCCCRNVFLLKVYYNSTFIKKLFVLLCWRISYIASRSQNPKVLQTSSMQKWLFSGSIYIYRLYNNVLELLKYRLCIIWSQSLFSLTWKLMV